MPVSDPSHFLKHYWQKKPCLIKQFIPHFNDPIDEHELAGLAQEPEIDARIVRQIDGEWEVFTGPFEHYDELCQGRWSLLVQGVDTYIEEIAQMFSHVDFIPEWRTDDVMVSFSVKDAGVGAHIDEYDVFIVQGKGKRRWQVGKPGYYEQKHPHPKLRLIENFTPMIDEVLLPGDAIYIPPFHPHKGQTLENTLNYSLGFRAPNATEMLDGIAEKALANKISGERYQDPNLSALRASQRSRFELSDAELSQLKSVITKGLEDGEYDAALLAYLSEQKQTLMQTSAITPVSKPIVEQASHLLVSGIYYPLFFAQEDHYLISIAGNNYVCSEDFAKQLQQSLAEGSYLFSPHALQDNELRIIEALLESACLFEES